MKIKTDLIIEDVETTDRRLIAPEATVWGDGTLWWIRSSEQHAPRSVGTIDRLYREQNRVVAMATIWTYKLPPRVLRDVNSGKFRLEADCASLDLDDAPAWPDAPVLRMRSLMIIGATLGTAPAWPDLRFEVLP